MKKILLIEDDLIDQMAFERMFKKSALEYEYCIASSVAKAKSKLKNHNFDLVISDHNLADGTTFDLLEELKKIPFILITGNEDEATINSIIRSSEVITCLTKDLNLDYLQELPKLIHQVFETKTPLSEIALKRKQNKNCKRLQRGDVVIDFTNTIRIFDGKKRDIREAIEIFIEYKPQEMDDLYAALSNCKCEDVVKISHRMKSGLRVLGMKTQEELADYIENNVSTKKGTCNCDGFFGTFKKLSSDIKIAVDLLKNYLLSND